MRTFCFVFLVSCASGSFLLTSGCGAGTPATIAASPALAGNWNIAEAAAPVSSSQIASFGGALSVSSSGSIVGVLHTIPVSGKTAAGLCVPPSAAIPVSGTLSADNTLSLQSSPVSGNTLLVRGTYTAATATTQASLTGGTYSITGTCAVAAQPARAVRMNAISGTYTGTFVSSSGSSVPVSATLTQTTQPDSNGTYHLQGNATFPPDSCVVSPVVTDSTVTGNAFSATYTDQTTHATVTASGTLSTDASVLTISSYTLTGPNGCSDTGTGSLHL